MAENHAEIDEAAVRELFTEEDGPVGTLIRELCDEGAAIARSLAPRDTGRLEGSIRVVMTRDGEGTVYGVYGATAHADPPLSHPGWEAGYPYALAVDNRQGFTRNRGHKSARPLHRFLTASLQVLEGRAG